MAIDNYGISGSGTKRSTSPTASTPAATGTGSLPPPIRMSTIPSIAEQMEERKRKYGSVNVGGAYLTPTGTTSDLGTTVRPTPSRAKLPYFGGTPTNKSGYTPPIGKPSVYQGGTPTNPAGYVSRAPYTGPIVYQGGTPTNTGGYVAYPDYFGGTPTSTVGYDPNAQPTSPSELEAIKKAEDERKKREQKAADDTTTTTTTNEPDWSQLPALTPEQQRAYRQGMRLANREYEADMNQIRYEQRGARRDYRQGVRSVNRQQAGGSQDLATALAYLGLDTSPATMGVGLQDLERQADLDRAGLAATKADTLAGLESRVLNAEIRKNRTRAQIRQQKADQQAASATNLQRYFEENMR